MNNCVGIYIHIPFCKAKCPYCAFYSVIPTKNLINNYTEALIKNISNYNNLSCNTIYFGGGTPILLGIDNIIKVLNQIKQNFCLNNPEITIEANPNSISLDDLRTLYNAGFNRISFGLQSAVDSELALLGRGHTSSEVVVAVNNAKAVGFENISLDVMLGIKNQTKNTLKQTLDFAISLDVNHISCYMLKQEPNTPFYNYDKSDFPDEDLVADFYLFCVDFLEKNGFLQYEISNFSKNNSKSLHNNKYWNLQPYIGFGASAHSFFQNKRFAFSNNIDDYINGKPYFVIDSLPTSLMDYVMLKLRLCSGIDVDELSLIYSINAENMLALASDTKYKKFFNVKGRSISLTPEGFLVSNSLILYLLQ